ncbi:MAG: four helix bundle protein [Patescibacteria group bacterium]
MEKIKSFTDLKAWQEAHKMVLGIYRATLGFPKYEVRGLSDQIRRAAVSVSSNIAEGFSRRSNLEKKQFYYLSLGSLTEVQNQMLIGRDVGYLKIEDFKKLAELSVGVSKLINSLIKFLNNY